MAVTNLFLTMFFYSEKYGVNRKVSIDEIPVCLLRVGRGGSVMEQSAGQLEEAFL
jgi:hypothetical protein